MKVCRWLVLLAVLALVLSVGVAAVSAAGTGPVGAPYVDNTSHLLSANSDTWYRFEYDGSHSQITVRLVDGQNSGLAFEVYPPTHLQEWWKYEGIGVGSAQEDDLIWSGNSHEGGSWYVRVINNTLITKPFQLVVTGEDVAFVIPPVAQVGMSSPVIASVENNVPDKALVVDASTKVIPANTTLWYRFAYEGTRDQVTIKIPDGSVNNLHMEILTPSQVLKWWESATKPIGQGTPHQDDLIWSGNSSEAGLWYIKIVNNNAAPVGFTFHFEYLENARQPH